MNVIEKAIPLFFVLIFVEVALGFFRGRKYYRLNDSIVDLSTSIIFGIAGVFITIGFLYVYSTVEGSWSLTRLLGIPDRVSAAPLGISAGFPYFEVQKLTAAPLPSTR